MIKKTPSSHLITWYVEEFYISVHSSCNSTLTSVLAVTTVFNCWISLARYLERDMCAALTSHQSTVHHCVCERFCRTPPSSGLPGKLSTVLQLQHGMPFHAKDVFQVLCQRVFLLSRATSWSRNHAFHYLSVCATVRFIKAIRVSVS